MNTKQEMEFRIKSLEDVLVSCRNQFQFYADEHLKADKKDKAKTNQYFADLCKNILQARFNS